MGVTAIPRDSNGQYSLPPIYLATTGQTVLAVQHNSPCEDMAAALTGSLARNGSGDMQADLPMGGFRVRNMADGTASTDAVSKAQLDAVQALVSAIMPTGTRLELYRTTAPSGFVAANGNTIGSASSGATGRANADTEALFTLFWNTFDNTLLPIQNSSGTATTRGSTAAADFAANKRLPVFDDRDLFSRASGTGRAVGSFQDEAFKSHVHTGETETAQPAIDTASGGGFSPGNPFSLGRIDGVQNTTTDAQIAHDHDFTTDATGGTETRPKNRAVLVCIKL